MSFLDRIGDLPAPISDVVRITDSAGGAVLVFDRDDRLLLANGKQREVMPVCGYGPQETYSSIFWALTEKGMTGNPVARQSPEEWLPRAIAARQNCTNMDFVNTYPWGSMLVSHLRIEGDGTSIQARLDMTAMGMERYFEGPTGRLGVTRALRLRNEIRLLESALDSLGLAVAMVDGMGNILHANSSFSDLIRSCDGLSAPYGTCLTATDPLDDIVLRQALKNVASSALPAAYVPIRRKHGDPLILAISGGSAGSLIVAASRFGEDTQEVERALRETLNLTPTEAEVVVGLAGGETVATLSIKRGVRTGTTYRAVDDVKKKLKDSRFSAPDLPGIARLVTGIAAITRAPDARKH